MVTLDLGAEEDGAKLYVVGSNESPCLDGNGLPVSDFGVLGGAADNRLWS